MKKSTKLTLTAVGAAILTYLIVRYHEKILKSVAPPLLDGLTSGQDITTQTVELASSGDKIRVALDTRPDNDHNRRILSHLIGIERWGRRRILVALGEPLIDDEYNGYRPRPDRSWEELKETFVQTRRDTVNVAHQLAQANPEIRIPHNQFGELSLLDWLAYLRLHADIELQKMRR